MARSPQCPPGAVARLVGGDDRGARCGSSRSSRVPAVHARAGRCEAPGPWYATPHTAVSGTPECTGATPEDANSPRRAARVVSRRHSESSRGNTSHGCVASPLVAQSASGGVPRHPGPLPCKSAVPGRPRAATLPVMRVPHRARRGRVRITEVVAGAARRAGMRGPVPAMATILFVSTGLTFPDPRPRTCASPRTIAWRHMRF